MQYYRLTSNSMGMYEAADKDCPKDDIRRANKPDGSWLPNKGSEYPGAISFWKEYGIKLKAGQYELMTDYYNGRGNKVYLCRINADQEPILNEGLAMKWMTIEEVEAIGLGFFSRA